MVWLLLFRFKSYDTAAHIIKSRVQASLLGGPRLVNTTTANVCVCVSEWVVYLFCQELCFYCSFFSLARRDQVSSPSPSSHPNKISLLSLLKFQLITIINKCLQPLCRDYKSSSNVQSCICGIRQRRDNKCYDDVKCVAISPRWESSWNRVSSFSRFRPRSRCDLPHLNLWWREKRKERPGSYRYRLCQDLRQFSNRFVAVIATRAAISLAASNPCPRSQCPSGVAS